MIWSSVVIIAAALVLLVTGVLASSLELTYVSIGVSLLAAIVLAIGVILRRDELFGTAGTARPGGRTDWPTAGVRAMVGGRTAQGRGGQDNGDLASVPRPGTPTAAGAGPRREGGRGATGPAKARPGKAGPGAARAGEHSTGRAGGGRPTGSPPVRHEPAGRDPAVARSTDGELGWPGRTGRERAGSRADREDAPPGRRDRDRDRDRTAARSEGRDAPPPRPPGFRVPPFGERPAWPATAGPRAMGTGPAKQPLPEPRNGGPEPRNGGPEPPVPPSGFRLAEPAAPEQEPGTESPEREQDWGEQAAADSRAGRGLFEPFVTGTPRPADGERAEDIWQAGDDEAVEVPEPPAGEAGALAAEDGDAGEAEDTGDADRADEEAELAAGPQRPPADDPGKRPGEPDKPGADEADGSAATPLDGEVAIVPGITRYHRRRCILIRFLSDGDLETMTRAAAEAAGSMPCKACQPDKAVPG